jgi:RNA polymerase sigma factor (sigma-70 family)
MSVVEDAPVVRSRRDVARSRVLGDPIGLYLEEIGRHPLLTPQSEQALAATIAAGQNAARSLEVSPTVTPTQRRRLDRLVAEGRTAHEAFVNANLRLVVSVAKKYQASGVPLLDLIQEGNLGLIRAVDKFDHEKGFRFSTYAVWWIRQFVSRGIAATRSTVRLPSRANDEMLRLREMSSQMEQVLGRTPTSAELAELSGIGVARVAELLSASDPISLSGAVGEDGGAELGDFIEDPTSRADVEQASNQLSDREVAQMMSVLDQRESHILSLRFGFGGQEPRSVSEVAEVIGLSRERIRQLEHRAMAKLMHPSWQALHRYLGDG